MMEKEQSYARAGIPIRIHSNHSLEVLAEVISENILGGARFRPLTKADADISNLYNDVPAVRANILGLCFVLQGYGGDDGHFLDVFEVRKLHDPLYPRRDTYMVTHVGGMLLYLEEERGDLEISADPGMGLERAGRPIPPDEA